jgi:hypothetical protein
LQSGLRLGIHSAIEPGFVDDILELIDYIHRRGCNLLRTAGILTLISFTATVGGQTVAVPSTGSTQALVSREASLPTKGRVHRQPAIAQGSAGGAAAAIAAPAAIACVVISKSTNRQLVSSLAP